jgi:hypothetical protein
MIYIVRAGDTEMTKIGYALEVAQRVKELQTASWEVLTVIREMPGDRGTEATLHRHFKAYRVLNEWFRFHPDMLTIEVTEGLRRDQLSPHSDVIEAFGGTRPLAEAISVDHRRAIHWHERGIPAKYWSLVEMAARTREIPVTAYSLMTLIGAT